MTLPPEILRRVAQVAHARTTSFVVLVKIAGLDPARSFRGADLRGVDFGQDDLSGFDFTGADLRGADLSRATGIERVMFDGAQLEGAKWLRPPAFSIEEVKEMILAGQAPPSDWAPFIFELDFGRTRIVDLSPLSGLHSLQTLNLWNTKAADVAPLSGLSLLQTL